MLHTLICKGELNYTKFLLGSKVRMSTCSKQGQGSKKLGERVPEDVATLKLSTSNVYPIWVFRLCSDRAGMKYIMA